MSGIDDIGYRYLHGWDDGIRICFMTPKFSMLHGWDDIMIFNKHLIVNI